VIRHFGKSVFEEKKMGEKTFFNRHILPNVYVNTDMPVKGRNYSLDNA